MPVNCAGGPPRQYAPENLGVILFSKDSSMQVKEVKGWKMRSIWDQAVTRP